jgi:hypothetical protein
MLVSGSRLLRRLQERRAGQYRLTLPEICLPQYCVYLASDVREREQECPQLGKDPQYQPTADDWLVRYLKALISWTMDRNACHVAVALGCFLHGYPPGDIARLAPELFNAHNIRRVKRRLALELQARFQCAQIFTDTHLTLRTRPATEHDRQLVQHVLALFTPWGAPHIRSPAAGYSILETHFAGASICSDWDRIHALIDPTCAGLAGLIREYNQQFPSASAARLEDPDQTLKIPCFFS